MAEAIASVLGWCVLLFGAGALSLYVVRRARVHGVLVPVLVALVLRLAVMLIAHAGSLSLGDHGILFLDDETYFRGAGKIADFWRHGHTPDPARVDILGTYQFGYQLFLGVLFTLGTTSVLLGKLVNVMLGAVTVLVVALLAGRLLGERAKVRAAWVIALAPNLVWWSAPMLKEVLATLVLALGLLAVTYLPRLKAVIGLGAILAFLLILRGPAALALMVGAATAVALAGRKAEGRWLSRPLLVLTGALLGGLVVVAAVVSRGQIQLVYHQYDVVVHNMIREYQGSNPARVPYDALKSLVTPLPWVFDRGTRYWDRGLYPGGYLTMCALPLAALGIRRLSRSPEAWAMVACAATSLTINAFTSGYVFRQRSMIEPIILILALAGATSWRMAARWAAAALVAIAVVAGGQSGSPLPPSIIAGCGGLLFLVSRRLPSRPFEPPPESWLVASFRRSLAARPAMTGRAPARALAELRHFLGAARASVVPLRAGVASAAPRIGEVPPAPSAPSAPYAVRIRAAVASAAPRIAEAPPAPPAPHAVRIRAAAASAAPRIAEAPRAHSGRFERAHSRVAALAPAVDHEGSSAE
jgi:hypothetical protein